MERLKSRISWRPKWKQRPDKLQVGAKIVSGVATRLTQNGARGMLGNLLKQDP